MPGIRCLANAQTCHSLVYSPRPMAMRRFGRVRVVKTPMGSPHGWPSHAAALPRQLEATDAPGAQADRARRAFRDGK